MNPLLLLGAAVAFLAFSRKPTPAVEPPTVSGDIPPTPTAPSFDTVTYPPKVKAPTTTGLTPVPELIAEPISGMGPVAICYAPPYVTQSTPEFSSFGTLEIERGV